MNFGLIKQIKEDVEILHLVEMRCSKIEKDNTVVLYESAQKILGTMAAQIAAGKNPAATDSNLVNIVAGLFILSDPNNIKGYNIDDVNLIKIINLTGTTPNATHYVAQIGARAPSLVTNLKKQLDRLPNMDTDAKRSLINKLNKLQFVFTQLKAKTEAKNKKQTQLLAV
jgi:hypothetical protein